MKKINLIALISKQIPNPNWSLDIGAYLGQLEIRIIRNS